MAGLTNKPIADSYFSLIRVDNNSTGITTGLQRLTDGEGTNSGLLLADNGARVQPDNADNTEIFSVRDNDANYLLRVDSTNDVVKANVGQEIINTQYAYFNVNNTDFADCAADYHYAIPFSGAGVGDAGNLFELSNSLDPEASKTTSAANAHKASDLIPVLWYVPDNITIDSVTALVGADLADGDTLNLHLYSYTFTSGSTSALADGTELAYSHSNANDGWEQAYKRTYTVDSGNKNVIGGKVIIATLEAVSTVNSDYSVQVIVKYHLT